MEAGCDRHFEQLAGSSLSSSEDQYYHNKKTVSMQRNRHFSYILVVCRSQSNCIQSYRGLNKNNSIIYTLHMVWSILSNPITPDGRVKCSCYLVNLCIRMCVCVCVCVCVYREGGSMYV